MCTSKRDAEVASLEGLSKLPQPFLKASVFKALASVARSVSLSEDQTIITLLGLRLDEILVVDTERSKRYMDGDESGPTQLQHLSSSARIFIAESEKMVVDAFAPIDVRLRRFGEL